MHLWNVFICHHDRCCVYDRFFPFAGDRQFLKIPKRTGKFQSKTQKFLLITKFLYLFPLGNNSGRLFPIPFPLSIYVKISVTFLGNFWVSEVQFISVRIPSVGIPTRSIFAKHGIAKFFV